MALDEPRPDLTELPAPVGEGDRRIAYTVICATNRNQS